MTRTKIAERRTRRDPVVEAFRADVDVTLLEENLRLSVEERFLKLIELQRFAAELRDAGERATGR
jgi:hypothetical protein